MAQYTYAHKSWGNIVGTWIADVWESDIDTNSNTSVINVNFYIQRPDAKNYSQTRNLYDDWRTYSEILIDGVQVTARSTPFDLRYNFQGVKTARGTTIYLVSCSKRIQHNSDGTYSVKVQCHHDCGGTSPENVWLGGTISLTKINKPAPPPPPPPPPPTPIASHWELPQGCYDVGSNYSCQYLVKDPNYSLSHHVYIKKPEHSSWTCVVWDHRTSYNNWGNISFKIPESFRDGLGPQVVSELQILAQTYNGGTYVGHTDKYVTIKNNQSILNFDVLRSVGDLAVGNSLIFYWEANTTLGIKHLSYSVSGAFSMWGDASNNLGTGCNIPVGVIPCGGTVTLTVTLTDWGGKTVSKSITLNIPIPYYLDITGLEQTNGKIYIKKTHTIGATQMKIKCSWNNTDTITNIKFEMSGANSDSHSKNYPGGKSYTWTTGHVYNVGNNTIKVSLTDSKGTVRTKQITVYSAEEASTMNVDGSYVDSTICVNLVKGLAYKDHSRLGYRFIINHTHRLHTVKVTINGVDHTLKNFDPNASNFSYVDSNKVDRVGSNTITFYAKDVNGKEDYHTVTYTTYKIIDPPKVPTISYEVPYNIFLSEGEKLVFQGESTSLTDYKVIYGLSKCNVAKAMKPFDDLNGSYIEANKGELASALRQNVDSTMRYYVAKDFGVGEAHTFMTRDGDKKNKFHIHPTGAFHSNKFYALQFFERAEPGDMIYIYVIERKMGTFDKYLYSNDTTWNKIPKGLFFPMCVLPPGPRQLNIYKSEQTSDKLIIKYANPLYNMPSTKSPINLIDVCLIARDKNGNHLDIKGAKSKSKNRRREGLNGKTWIYYTDRKWHNVVPLKTTSKNNKKEFEMMFDIANYPSGTSFSIVAFYYTDYYNHPSIYSTSNIINVNKMNIDMNLSILQPYNNTTSTTANPTFKVRVSKGEDVPSFSNASIYENYNLATKWTDEQWANDPILFKVPRNQDRQLPNFNKANCYTSNHPYSSIGEYPNHYIEFYSTNEKLYINASIYKIAGMNINDEGSYKENALFLKANNNNQVQIGDIETYTLLEKGYIDYTWTQKSGRFLSMGENTITAFTSPYIYSEDIIDYEELDSYWISDTTLYSMPIMPYNLFRDFVIKPSDKSWDSVEAGILNIKMPYGLFKPNKQYKFSFSRYVDTGFLYDRDEKYVVTNQSDIKDLCCTRVYLDIKGESLTGIKCNKDTIIYSPQYTLVNSNKTTKEFEEYNDYDKWIPDEIEFTTPAQDILYELDKNNKFITISIKVRGVNIFKLKDIKLGSSDGSHMIDTNKGEIDKDIKENMTSIKVLYAGSVNIDFDYIDPLKYKDMMDLRDYIKAIAIIYGIDIKPKWRTLVKNESYLMARDYNDTVNHCKELFTAIKNKYPTTFKGNVNLFNNLPVIKPGYVSPYHTNSKLTRGKTYFPEWDDLVDTIKVVLSFKDEPAPAKPTGKIDSVDYKDISSLADLNVNTYLTNVSRLQFTVNFSGNCDKYKVVVSTEGGTSTTRAVKSVNDKATVTTVPADKTFLTAGKKSVIVDLYDDKTNTLLDHKTYTINAEAYKKPVAKTFKTVDYVDPALLYIYLQVESYFNKENSTLKFYSNGQLVATKKGGSIFHQHTVPKHDSKYYTYKYTYSDGITTISGTLNVSTGSSSSEEEIITPTTPVHKPVVSSLTATAKQTAAGVDDYLITVNVKASTCCGKIGKLTIWHGSNPVKIYDNSANYNVSYSFKAVRPATIWVQMHDGSTYDDKYFYF